MNSKILSGARRRTRGILTAAFGALLLASASGAFAQAKVGVIEVERILQESNAGKAVIAQLDALQKEKNEQLGAKQDAIESLQKQLQEGRLTLAEDRLAEMQKNLEDLTIEARRARDDAQRDFQKQQQEKFQEIERKVLPIITNVGKEQGYTVIFNKYQSGLLYADEAIDITDLVIQRFDATAGQ